MHFEKKKIIEKFYAVEKYTSLKGNSLESLTT